MSSKLVPEVLGYLEQVEAGAPPACRDQVALAAYVRRCFETEDIYTDVEQLGKYLGLVKYFPFSAGLMPWEEFLLTLWDCTYWSGTTKPRWPDVFCMVGRGAGKDGFISFDAACSVSPYNPVPHYDVDICANNQDQATRPVKDLAEVLETPRFEKKLNRHFYHTKELVQGIRNKGVVRGHTNNPKGRDGLRPGKIIFNEVHSYENYDNISVFTTALGKRAEPRTGYFTSNGIVSDGPLDDLLERGRRILHEGEPDQGLLPFICCLDSMEEIHNPDAWAKANPSLPYNDHLREEIAKEYRAWVDAPDQNYQLPTKRFGLRSGQAEMAVTAYEKIKLTNKPLPTMTGWSCTVGLDYAELSDWAAVNLHFRRGEYRFDINHAWVCTKSKTLSRVRAPWKYWASIGIITIVDDETIHPRLLAEYIQQAGTVYNVKKLAMDNFRWTLVSDEMKKIGFDAADKNRVKLVRPTDIMMVDPVIQYCFDRDLFSWGDNPCLRWSVNNTKRCRSSRSVGSDTGNFYYAKIEAKSRKTDPFMALVASMVVEPVLGTGLPAELPPLGAISL